MSVGVGLGLTEFPFAGAADYWRWVDLCEAGGVDSLWQTDRLVSRQPILECMATMAALAGRTRRLRFVKRFLNRLRARARRLPWRRRGSAPRLPKAPRDRSG